MKEEYDETVYPSKRRKTTNKKPSSISNAQKAREAKMVKYLERKKQQEEEYEQEIQKDIKKAKQNESSDDESEDDVVIYKPQIREH